jgi:vanillate O-demethylase monooxygenase subunit
MYLTNAWYVAATSNELGREPLAVTMLEEDLVLYRRTDGKVTALENACPHRKLPLSMGRVKGDHIECGYHGLTFDRTGTCVRAACVERLPSHAHVRPYPAEERYGLIWVWMGAAEQADPATIFHVEHWGDPAWGLNAGDSMAVDCNYLYVTDNLLDPSHVAWVHQSSFGNAACADTALQTTVSDQGVTVSRWMLDTEPAPFYAPFLKFSGNCDRKQHYEVHFPSHAIIKAIFVPAGTGGDGRAIHPDAFLMDSYNFMTPVNEDRTRYFWFQLRNFAPGDAQVSATFAASVRDAFEEDRVVMQAVHRGMKYKRTPNIGLAIDAGPQRFRRRLAQMIAAEREHGSVANPPGLAIAE